MSDESSSGHWLNPATMICPQCNAHLYRVDHSPMADDWMLYCEQCANRVEVSYYDPVTLALDKTIPSGDDHYRVLITHIEDRLKPCDCGGRFRFDAPRRCYNCLTAMITDGGGRDLWPAYYDINVDERDPTEEEEARAAAFEEAHVRRDNIWR
ncbi:MAG TPA: hypothetical protein VFT66_17605 [Roseiflexaceae bacterium]|jgi:hypothetical protein|nr:hypothetical protein [Roseiflexaceae bacterium]